MVRDLRQMAYQFVAMTGCSAVILWGCLSVWRNDRQTQALLLSTHEKAVANHRIILGNQERIIEQSRKILELEQVIKGRIER